MTNDSVGAVIVHTHPARSSGPQYLHIKSRQLQFSMESQSRNLLFIDERSNRETVFAEEVASLRDGVGEIACDRDRLGVAARECICCDSAGEIVTELQGEEEAALYAGPDITNASFGLGE